MPARMLDEPERTCEWCDRLGDEPCEGTCACPPCEGERALDDDAAAYLDRSRD